MIAGDVLESRIRSDGLVSPFRREAFRGSSYELLTGKVVRAGGETISLFDDQVSGGSSEVFRLGARETVTIVSREIVKCPDDMTYVCQLADNLTDGGVIAIGAPMVEPGYEGPIAITVMNLSPSDRALSLKDVFLRLRFFAHDKVRDVEPVKRDHSDFLAQVKARMIERAPAVFVDHEALRIAAAEAARDEVRRRFPSLLLSVGVAVAVIGFLATAGLTFLLVASGVSLG